MIEFTTSGDDKDDYWLINGCKDFAIIPAGTIPFIIRDIPIRLKVGNQSFGEKHIHLRHKKWIKKNTTNNLVAELLYKKLQSSGDIYIIENEEKIVLALRVSPNTTIFLKRYDDHLSVISLYPKDKPDSLWTKGKRYEGYKWIFK